MHTNIKSKTDAIRTDIYLFKVSKGNNRPMWEICSKLTKTQEQLMGVCSLKIFLCFLKYAKKDYITY